SAHAGRSGLLPGNGTGPGGNDGLGGTDPPVASPRQGLHVERGARVVAERGADLLHAVVQPLVEVDQRVISPELGPELLPGDDGARAGKQHAEHPGGLLSEVHGRASLLQLEARSVELEASEPDAAGQLRGVVPRTLRSALDRHHSGLAPYRVSRRPAEASTWPKHRRFRSIPDPWRFQSGAMVRLAGAGHR